MLTFQPSCARYTSDPELKQLLAAPLTSTQGAGGYTDSLGSRRSRQAAELRERQRQQQAVLEQLGRVKAEKVKELQRRREEQEERRRREEEEARQAKLEQERLQKEEAERKIAQERERRRAEEKEKEDRRRAEEREKEERRRAEEREREERERNEGGKKPDSGANSDLHSQLTALFNSTANGPGVQLVLNAQGKLNTYRALYPFTARNADELTLEADCLIEVDESTVREPGWLYGSYGGNSGWFPESYAEKMNKDQADPPAGYTTAPSVDYTRIPRVDIEGPTPTHTPAVTHSQHAQAVALCAWTANTESHLGFSKDDVITVLEQQENWWYGELGENRGWFPKTHVSMVTNNNTYTEPLYSTVDELDLPDSGLLEEYVALYTYESPESGDLTFRAEDVILVIEKEGEWWKGCIGDQSGLFPSNYVKPKDSDTAKSGASVKKPEIAQVTAAFIATTAEQLSLTPGQLILVLHKNSCGWWLGERQARGKKRQKGWFHSSNIKLLEPNSGKTTPAPQPLCQVIAMYDYKAANEDEMSFLKGQLINVLNKDDSDWWKGELNGVTGLFPTNYVKMTTESDPSQQCVRVCLQVCMCLQVCVCLQLIPNTVRDQADQTVLRTPAAPMLDVSVSFPHRRGFLNSSTSFQTSSGVFSQWKKDGQKHLMRCSPDLKQARSWMISSLFNDESFRCCLIDLMQGVQTAEFRLHELRGRGSGRGYIHELHSHRTSQEHYLPQDLEAVLEPVFLNEVLVKMPSDPSSDDPIFHISHIDRVYTLKADSINERTTWVQRIKAASEHFIETEKLKREKAYQGSSLPEDKRDRTSAGKSKPVTVSCLWGAVFTHLGLRMGHTPPQMGHFTCQFFIKKDLYQERPVHHHSSERDQCLVLMA
ncbi:hypothetical protein NFI96_008925, partial [Prochilodus magdalenae]